LFSDADKFDAKQKLIESRNVTMTLPIKLRSGLFGRPRRPGQVSTSGSSTYVKRQTRSLVDRAIDQ